MSSPRQGIGMVPGGRLFIVGCSDGDVFAFEAKVYGSLFDNAVLQQRSAYPASVANMATLSSSTYPVYIYVHVCMYVCLGQFIVTLHI